MIKKDPIATRTKILDSALLVIRTKGYAATTIDDLCAGAGVTKGAFFHHFANKEQLAVEAAEHFGRMAEGLFAQAPYRRLESPIDRLLGYVDFRIQILAGPIPGFTCLLGTLVQEVHCSSPQIRNVCEEQLKIHTDELERDIRLAIAEAKLTTDWSPASLASHIQAVIQGAFILTKASEDAEVAVSCLQHLRRYLQFLFQSRHVTNE